MRFARAWATETARSVLEEIVELWRLIPEWVKPYKH